MEMKDVKHRPWRDIPDMTQASKAKESQGRRERSEYLKIFIRKGNKRKEIIKMKGAQTHLKPLKIRVMSTESWNREGYHKVHEQQANMSTPSHEKSYKEGTLKTEAEDW